MAALPATGPLGEPTDLVRTATTIEQVRTEADKAEGACAGPPRPPTRARCASANSSWRSR